MLCGSLLNQNSEAEKFPFKGPYSFVCLSKKNIHVELKTVAQFITAKNKK
jgi:hypothetical protein